MGKKLEGVAEAKLLGALVGGREYFRLLEQHEQAGISPAIAHDVAMRQGEVVTYVRTCKALCEALGVDYGEAMARSQSDLIMTGTREGVHPLERFPAVADAVVTTVLPMARPAGTVSIPIEPDADSVGAEAARLIGEEVAQHQPPAEPPSNEEKSAWQVAVFASGKAYWSAYNETVKAALLDGATLEEAKKKAQAQGDEARDAAERKAYSEMLGIEVK